MRRSSNSRKAFKRSKLLLGIPKNAFYLLLLGAACIAMFKQWAWLPSLILFWAFMRKATNKDPEWFEQFEGYSKENHVYDSLPRKLVWERVPKGWGKGIPW